MSVRNLLREVSIWSLGFLTFWQADMAIGVHPNTDILFDSFAYKSLSNKGYKSPASSARPRSRQRHLAHDRQDSRRQRKLKKAINQRRGEQYTRELADEYHELGKSKERKWLEKALSSAWGTLSHGLFLSVGLGFVQTVGTAFKSAFTTAFHAGPHPRIKRWVQKRTTPDSWYRARTLKKGRRPVEDMVFNKPVEVQIHTYKKALETALHDGEALPWLLLYGKPGTGKTEMAKRICTELGLETKIIPGVAWKRMHPQDEIHLLQFLDDKSPVKKCAILDEAESLLRSLHKSRTDSLQTWLTYTGTLSQNYVFIAATNYAGEIDEAASRRFTNRVHVELPNGHSRAQLFDLYLEDYGRDIEMKDDFMGDMNVREAISEASESLSGADIKTICLTASSEASLSEDRVLDAKMLMKQVEFRIKSREDLMRERVNARQTLEKTYNLDFRGAALGLGRDISGMIGASTLGEGAAASLGASQGAGAL